MSAQLGQRSIKERGVKDRTQRILMPTPISRVADAVCPSLFAGAGTYRLGSNVLTIGNTLSTTVSGNIVDAGIFAGVGGGLIKVGTSTLTLSGVNAYTGGTLISAGTLQAGSTTGLSSRSAFTVNSVLDLAGFSDTVDSLAGGGND